MKQLVRWFLIILISLLFVILGGFLFIKVVVPLTSWIWYEKMPDGASRVHGRALVFIVGLLLLSLAATLAGVTRIVDWVLFPKQASTRKQTRLDRK